MDLNEFSTDTNLRESGSWVEFDDASFLIRSTDSKAYRRAQLKVASKAKNRLAKDAEKIVKASAEMIADAILLDWKNVTDNGVALECNRENKLKLLKHPELRDFIATEAQDLENFKREAAGEDAAEVKSGD